MKRIGQIENLLYTLRAKHPLVIPQLDPAKYNPDESEIWLKNVKEAEVSVIALVVL